jgi:tetratricopeptide (TPR) repeat protein
VLFYIGQCYQRVLAAQGDDTPVVLFYKEAGKLGCVPAWTGLAGLYQGKQLVVEAMDCHLRAARLGSEPSVEALAHGASRLDQSGRYHFVVKLFKASHARPNPLSDACLQRVLTAIFPKVSSLRQLLVLLQRHDLLTEKNYHFFMQHKDRDVMATQLVGLGRSFAQAEILREISGLSAAKSVGVSLGVVFTLAAKVAEAKYWYGRAVEEGAGLSPAVVPGSTIRAEVLFYIGQCYQRVLAAQGDDTPVVLFYKEAGKLGCVSAWAGLADLYQSKGLSLEVMDCHLRAARLGSELSVAVLAHSSAELEGEAQHSFLVRVFKAAHCQQNPLPDLMLQQILAPYFPATEARGIPKFLARLYGHKELSQTEFRFFVEHESAGLVADELLPLSSFFSTREILHSIFRLASEPSLELGLACILMRVNNLDRANAWFERAIEKGVKIKIADLPRSKTQSQVIFSIAQFYRRSKPNAENLRLAVSFHERLSSGGFVPSHLCLAELYQREELYDLDKAFNYYILAAKQRDARAMPALRRLARMDQRYQSALSRLSFLQAAGMYTPTMSPSEMQKKAGV